MEINESVHRQQFLVITRENGAEEVDEGRGSQIHGNGRRFDFEW